MSGVLDYLGRLFGGMVFWIIVLPWQQALRVRAGRYTHLLKPGLYLKLPVIDVVQIESVRRRSSIVPCQTLSTADGATVTVSAVVQYAIDDLGKLYGSLHHAEDTIAQTAQGVIAAAVFRLRRSEIEPARVSAALNEELAEVLARYGLSGVSLHITDFAFVRAIRLIQEQRWAHGRALDTQGAQRSVP